MSAQTSVEQIILKGLRENAAQMRQIAEQIFLLSDNLEDMFEAYKKADQEEMKPEKFKRITD